MDPGLKLTAIQNTGNKFVKYPGMLSDHISESKKIIFSGCNQQAQPCMQSQPTYETNYHNGPLRRCFTHIRL